MDTQKAKGIMLGIPEFVDKIDENIEHSKYFRTPNHYLLTSEQQIKSNYYILPAFARPCPKVPKHGFIESRLVRTQEELLQLWKQVKKADPWGEIILGPDFKRVDFNAIYVNSGQLSIGPSNDGATSGKNSIIFPVAPQKFSKSFLKNISVGHDEAVYIEAIYSSTSNWDCPEWYLTQFRGGPKIAGAALDFIPKRIKINKIVAPSNDLVEWEKITKTIKPGTVVYGKGYTLASHAAVHCILNKVPFITSHEPKVGEILRPSNNKNAKLSADDFKRGVCSALKFAPKVENVRAFNFSLSVLHNWAYLKNSKHASWLLGAASTMYAQICLSLVVGEYRHGSGKILSNLCDLSREGIYDDVFAKTGKYVKNLPKVMKDFYSTQWNDGFGGFPWATCAWYSYRLWQTIINTYKTKNSNISEKNVSELVNAINKTTNLAHNNGWWFNKFTEQETMDFAAKNPGLVAFSCADIYYQLHKLSQNIKIKEDIFKMDDVSPPFVKDKKGNIVWYAARIEESYWGEDDAHLYINTWSENKGDYCKDYLLNEKEFSVFKKYAKKKGLSLRSDNIMIPLKSGSMVLPHGKKVKII